MRPELEILLKHLIRGAEPDEAYSISLDMVTQDHSRDDETCRVTLALYDGETKHHYHIALSCWQPTPEAALDDAVNNLKHVAKDILDGTFTEPE